MPQLCLLKFHCIQQLCLLSIGFKWVHKHTYIEQELSLSEERLENSVEELHCQLEKINRVLARDKSLTKQGFFSSRRTSSMFVC